jgi:hypothetical protein
MPVHHVANGGMVVAYEPLPEDRFVVVILGTPDGARELHTTPIHRYDEALAFAQKYAPFMAHPITLLPITAKEYVERNQGSLTRLWEQLPPDVRATAAAAYEGRFQ